MTTIWKELPEINRKVAFNYNYVGVGVSLGCHCNSISGVSATFGNRYYAANEGHNVEVLDTTKEKQFAYIRGEYSYDKPQSPLVEINKVVQYLKDKKFAFEDIAPEAYPEIIEKCKNYPLWVMSDVINYEAPARTPVLGSNVVFETFGSTGAFVKYLIDNKIGYIMASPIVQNPSHRSKTNYSLNQGWFWIPPKHLDRALNVGKYYGTEQFPSKKEWIETVGKDLGFMGIEHPEKVLKSVLNTGAFPKETRFPLKRGSNGRFLSKPNISAA